MIDKTPLLFIAIPSLLKMLPLHSSCQKNKEIKTFSFSVFDFHHFYVVFFAGAPFYVFLCIFLLTDKIPLPIGYVGRDVHVNHLEVQQPAVVGPGAKFQITLLYIKWEPPDINVTGTLQNACRDVLENLNL